MLGILWLAAFWADLGTEVNPGRKSVAPSFCSFATLDREKMRSFIEGHFSKDLFRSSWLSSRSSVKLGGEERERVERGRNDYDGCIKDVNVDNTNSDGSGIVVAVIIVRTVRYLYGDHTSNGG